MKPSDPGTVDQVRIGLHADGAHVRCEFLSLREYVRMAFQVKDYQISAPDWMTSQRFDITANLPEGATQAQIPEMLQSLLRERFGLKTHREQKEFAVYALTVGRGGPKLKEAAPDDSGPATGNAPLDIAGGGSGRGVSIAFGHGSSFNFANNRLIATRLTMLQLADTIARFEDKPVLDMTGLTAAYDISLDLSEEDYRAMLIRAGLNSGVVMPPAARIAMEAASGESFNHALQTVGLKIETRKAPLEVLVVDHAERSPGDN